MTHLFNSEPIIDKGKYFVSDLEKYPKSSHLAIVGLMIANEIYFLRKTLQRKK